MIDWAVLGLMATSILGYTLFWIQVRRWRKLMSWRKQIAWCASTPCCEPC